jgi:prepilin-type processing-associated H-X9-DG protein
MGHAQNQYLAFARNPFNCHGKIEVPWKKAPPPRAHRPYSYARKNHNPPLASGLEHRSRLLATDLMGYNGGITSTSQTPPPNSEQAIAQSDHLTIESYLLDSIFTHKSARYAVEGVLSCFATDTLVANLPNRNVIMFSERNSEALDAPDNSDYGSVNQDDYDTWPGEAALVQWGSGNYGNQGWIRYNRHGLGANYIYADAHVEYLRWSKARYDQIPRPRRPPPPRKPAAVIPNCTRPGQRPPHREKTTFRT